MRTAFRHSGAVLRRSLTFFVTRYPIIAAFGLLASVQRFLAVGGDARFAFAGGPAGEAFTMVVRLLFLGWLVRTVLRPGGREPLQQAVSRGLSSFRDRRRFHLANVVVLVAMLMIAKVGIDAIGQYLVPDAAHQTFLAWELAIKNVTVIPYAMVWTVHVVAELMYPGSQTIRRRAADQRPVERHR